MNYQQESLFWIFYPFSSKSDFEKQKQITYNHLLNFLEKHLPNQPRLANLMKMLNELTSYSSFSDHCYVIEMLNVIQETLDEYILKNQ